MKIAMVAEIAYSAFAQATQTLKADPNAPPTWTDLDETEQKAWIAAVTAVRSPKLADLDDVPIMDAFDRLDVALGTPDLTVLKGETFALQLIELAIEKLREGEKRVVAA